jgi:hypothetical protein
MTNTANWFVSEKIKLTRAQVLELLKGEPVLIRTGSNVMGQTLCTRISVKGESAARKG